ncbi:stage IV sporulation protein FB [Caldanaerobius fijiensis DSM 17918]|uniref:Stage IV sporulation protein FB n=2 Tax=Caldanaerobius TaxID=862261 RepID=A0A1M4YAH5_9THEO|nr:stage IV sporulation protein FB [Caldanaerobius fijiensis DSM 17918]
MVFTINPSFVFILIFYGWSGYLLQASYFFAMILIHELAHFSMFLCYKVKVKNIELTPFGGKITYERSVLDLRQEMVILMAGPISNLLVGIALQFLGINGYYIQANYFLFLLNILPLVPLDGGKFSKLFLSQYIGHLKATRILCVFTYIIIVIVDIFVLIFIGGYKTVLNIAIFTLFVAWETYKESKEAIYTFMREIVYKKELIYKKKIMSTRHIVAMDTVTLKSILNSFVPNKYHLIVLLDENAMSYKIVDEIQIIDAILDLGLNHTLKDVINKRSETNEK